MDSAWSEASAAVRSLALLCSSLESCQLYHRNLERSLLRGYPQSDPHALNLSCHFAPQLRERRHHHMPDLAQEAAQRSGCG